MPDRTRVLWWSDTYWPAIGGMEVLASNLVTGLALRGFHMIVATSHNSESSLPDSENHDGIEIHRFRFHEALTTRRMDLWSNVLARVSRMKSEFRPDVVHLNFPSPSGIFHLLTERAWTTPTVAAIHTAFPASSQSADSLTHRILAASSFVTANSRAMLLHATAIAPEIETRSSVIYNGVPRPRHEASALPFHPPVIACIARLVEKKGVDVALRALALVKDRFPEVRMIVAGDGPERQKLEALARDLCPGDSVTFTGWVQPAAIPELIDSATLLVVPSRTTEPFGMVAVEAMQMSRPVICTNQGGLPEVVEAGKTGFVVAADDAPALADAMIRVLQNPTLARQLGQAGRIRADDCFSIERCIDAYELLYRRSAGDAAALQ